MSPNSRRFRSIVIGTVAVLAALAFVVVLWTLAGNMRRGQQTATAVGLIGPDTSTKAPDWSDVMVSTSAGKESLTSMTSVAMIVSSTCIHCHRMLAAMARANAGSKWVVVAVQGRAAADSLIKAAGLHATGAGPSPDADLWARQTGVQSVPTFLWFDDKGRIRDASIGEIDDAHIAVWASRTR